MLLLAFFIYVQREVRPHFQFELNLTNESAIAAISKC